MTIQTHEEFSQLVQSVGEHLPGNWDFTTNQQSWNFGSTLFDIERSLGIFFSLTRDKSKIEISGILPRNSEGQLAYIRVGEMLPRIAVSSSKMAAQIARDIEKRFLPVWLPRLEVMLQDIGRQEAYKTKTTSIADRIAALVKVNADGKKVSFYRSPYPVFSESMSGAEVHGDDVALELNLPHESALELLKWMIGK